MSLFGSNYSDTVWIVVAMSRVGLQCWEQGCKVWTKVTVFGFGLLRSALLIMTTGCNA